MRMRVIHTLAIPLLLLSFAAIGPGAHAAPAPHGAAPTARKAVNCYATISPIHWYTTGELYQDAGWSCYDAGYPRNGDDVIYYQQGGRGGPWVLCQNNCLAGYGPFNYSRYKARNYFPIGYCTNLQGQSEFWDENGRYYTVWSTPQYMCP